MNETILEVKDLGYSYTDGDHKRVIFEHLSASFEKGKFYSITGESGSGKTTFLYCIGGLDPDYSGEILYDGREIRQIGLDAYRRNDVSMIFQNYNLISYLSPLQNLYIAADITDNIHSIQKKQALKILNDLGIDSVKAKRKSSSLSGGEQQRTAIARSFVNAAPVILADEPTGNLDIENSKRVVFLFQKLAKKGKCIIMVTHNNDLANEADIHYVIDRKKHILQMLSNTSI